MTCFCKSAPVPTVAPMTNLSVRFVPPQLKNLLAMLGLQALPPLRIDQQLGDVLPAGGTSWLNATLAAQAPRLSFPGFTPGGGVMMTAMLSLSASAAVFPILSPKRLIAALAQAIQSLIANAMPRLGPIAAMPAMAIQRLALAARLTLNMRQNGVCPMMMANVDMRAGLPASNARAQAAVNFAARMPSMRIPPFALPLPQLRLAQNLAGLAPLGPAAQAVGLPPMSDPGFLRALQSMLKMLAAMPLLPLKMGLAALMEMIGKIADLGVIEEAFGPGAMTPGGISRINAMLRFFTKMRLPLPAFAAALNANLDATPLVPDVLKGMETAQTSGATLATSLSMSGRLAIPPIVPLMEALAMLSTMLGQVTGVAACGPCIACNCTQGAAASAVSNLPLPKAPSFSDFL